MTLSCLHFTLVLQQLPEAEHTPGAISFVLLSSLHQHNPIQQIIEPNVRTPGTPVFELDVTAGRRSCWSFVWVDELHMET